MIVNLCVLPTENLSFIHLQDAVHPRQGLVGSGANPRISGCKTGELTPHEMPVHCRGPYQHTHTYLQQAHSHLQAGVREVGGNQCQHAKLLTDSNLSSESNQGCWNNIELYTANQEAMLSSMLFHVLFN